jgi:hypothetical protein
MGQKAVVREGVFVAFAVTTAGRMGPAVGVQGLGLLGSAATHESQHAEAKGR